MRIGDNEILLEKMVDTLELLKEAQLQNVENFRTLQCEITAIKEWIHDCDGIRQIPPNPSR